MVITLNIPDAIDRKLESQKRRTGMSKSLIVRQILIKHYGPAKKEAS